MTPKQEKFCLSIIEGKSQTEAYKAAYNTSKMQADTINNRAYGLMQKSEIKARLDQLRKPVIEKAQITLEGHLNEMERLRELAIADKQYSAAIKAEEDRGKASGFYVIKTEHTGAINFTNMPEDELDRNIGQRLALLGLPKPTDYQ